MLLPFSWRLRKQQLGFRLVHKLEKFYHDYFKQLLHHVHQRVLQEWCLISYKSEDQNTDLCSLGMPSMAQLTLSILAHQGDYKSQDWDDVMLWTTVSMVQWPTAHCAWMSLKTGQSYIVLILGNEVPLALQNWKCWLLGEERLQPNPEPGPCTRVWPVLSCIGSLQTRTARIWHA